MTESNSKKLIAIAAAVVAVLGGGAAAGVYLYIEATTDPVPTPFDITKQDGKRYAARNEDLGAEELTEEQKRYLASWELGTA